MSLAAMETELRRMLGELADVEADLLDARREPIPFREFAASFLTTDAGAALAPDNALHEYLCDLLPAITGRRGARENVRAPRGSAKSTWSTKAYPLWSGCERLEEYIVLTADTAPQAVDYLRFVKDQFEHNDRLLAHYPEVAGPGPVWREDCIVLRNGVMIRALGTGQKVRGRYHGSHRPTLIVVDDPQNRDHIVSPLQRERSWEWLTKDVCVAGGPRTNIVVLGTPLHCQAIVCKLERAVGWHTKAFKSLGKMPERLDLWDEWQSILNDWDDDEHEAKARAYYQENRAEMDL